MTQPAAPAQPKAEADVSTDEVVLGTGAYGDPANPRLTRDEYEALEHPEDAPNNPSSASVAVTAPSGTSPVESEPSPTDPSPTEAVVQAPAAPAAPAS